MSFEYGTPKYESNPCARGRYAGRWPRCHFPTQALTYPFAASTSGIVTSPGSSPTSCFGKSTFVRPVRGG